MAAGWEVHGIDFDDKAIKSAKQQFGSSVRQGELIACDFPSGSFDAVVMNNVIEHVWNPIETVKECFRILGPRGNLIIITPNSDSDGHRLFKKRWRGLEPPRHLFIYSKRSLNLLSQMAGFAKTLIFSSSGGATGFNMLRSSAPTNYPNASIKRIVRLEAAKAVFGSMCGEWCVAICSKRN